MKKLFSLVLIVVFVGALVIAQEKSTSTTNQDKPKTESVGKSGCCRADMAAKKENCADRECCKMKDAAKAKDCCMEMSSSKSTSSKSSSSPSSKPSTSKTTEKTKAPEKQN
jgi:hypothetical protein